MPPYIRPFLATAQTTLRDPSTGEQYPFQGLYTTSDLPAGAFLGFYNGTFKDGSDYGGRNAYVFSLSYMHIIPRKTRGRVDARQYPLAMCNEPPPGTNASVAAVEHSNAAGVIPHLPPRTPIAALGFYTCRPVRAGDELFIHYGLDYHRGHYANPDGHTDARMLVGRPGFIRKRDRETPAQMAAHFGLHYVDRECYVEMK